MILPIIGEMRAATSDPPALVDMLGTTQYDIDAKLDGMSLDDISKIYALTQKWKSNLCKDSAIKAIAEVVDKFQRVQELAQRVDDVKKFGLYRFKLSYEEYVSNPDGVKNTAKFVSAIEKAKKAKEKQDQQDKIDRAVAEATAKARAEAQGEAARATGGLLSRMLG
eukprot:UN0305